MPFWYWHKERADRWVNLNAGRHNPPLPDDYRAAAQTSGTNGPVQGTARVQTGHKGGCPKVRSAPILVIQPLWPSPPKRTLPDGCRKAGVGGKQTSFEMLISVLDLTRYDLRRSNQ
jgi:hypothetical protein